MTPSERGRPAGARARTLLDHHRQRAWERLKSAEGLGARSLADSMPVPRVAASDWPTSPPDSGRHLLLGVTTYQRSDYLTAILESFWSTRSLDVEWTLVVADDGSTDDTHEVLQEFVGRFADQIQVIRIFNHAAGIAGQTNSILQTIAALGPDLAFVANDDVEFLRSGWDEAWWSAVERSGCDHLVYFDAAWKEPVHDHRSAGLRSLTDAANCQGAFFTVTPRVIESVGFFDEREFPVRGHSHIDFTMRACRAGYNEIPTLWDVEGSESYVRLQPRDGYRETFDWTSDAAKRMFDATERERRWQIIDQPDRVELTAPSWWRERSTVVMDPPSPELRQRLSLQPALDPCSAAEAFFDQVVVLNLRHQRDRWERVAAQLAAAGLRFHRFPAVYGYLPEHIAEWEAYERRGLELEHERALGRRLIQSPGALGYLLSMESILRAAIETRRRNILVFDDDVLLHKDASELIRHGVEDLPNDWLMWYLGSTQKNWDAVMPISDHLMDTGGQADGSYAVAVRAGILRDLLEMSEEHTWPYDAGPLRTTASRLGARAPASHPPVAIADVSESTIRAPRDLDSFAKRAKWPLGDYVRGERTSSCLHVVVSGGQGWAALLSTLESLRFQTHGRFRVSVVSPTTDRLSLEVLAAAQEWDTRVTGWSADGDGSPAEAINAVLDLEEQGLPTVLLQTGDVLPRNGLAALREYLSVNDVSGAVLPAVLAPAPVASRVIDHPEELAGREVVDGPLLVSSDARKALGDVEIDAAAGGRVWHSRLRMMGASVGCVDRTVALTLRLVDVHNDAIHLEEGALRKSRLAMEKPLRDTQRRPIGRVLPRDVAPWSGDTKSHAVATSDVSAQSLPILKS